MRIGRDQLVRLPLTTWHLVVRSRHTALVISAPAFLGAAAGVLTGQTGADATVVAALLPAVLTGVGGAVLAVKLKKENNAWTPDFLAASGAAIVFSVFLVAGMYSAFEANEAATERLREAQRQRYAEDLDFRAESIERCSKHEAEINARRVAALLDPLPTEAFCEIGPVSDR